MTPAEYEQARMEHARRVAAGVYQHSRLAYWRQRHRRVYVNRLRPNGSGYRRVVVRSDGRRFPSITAAAKSVGARSHSVIHRAITLGKPSFGYHWSTAA
jgi:hypothetical protein